MWASKDVNYALRRVPHLRMAADTTYSLASLAHGWYHVSVTWPDSHTESISRIR